MENRDDEGGQGPPGNPNQCGDRKGTENDLHKGKGDKESARPSPSGVPNEGRAQEIQQVEHQGGRPGQRRYSFKGQGQADTPNPNGPDLDDSAGSTRGTADKPIADDETRNPA